MSDSRKSFSVSISSCLLTRASRPRLISSREMTPKSWRIRLQQVLLGQERVQHERGERRPIDLLEQRAAQRRLAGADVAGDDDEAFSAPDGV